MHKYGREFAISVMANQDGCVSDRVGRYYTFPFTQYFSYNLTLCGMLKVVRKLDISTPSPELVDAYLAEITKAYGVQWTLPGENNTSTDDEPDGGVKVSDQ